MGCIAGSVVETKDRRSACGRSVSGVIARKRDRARSSPLTVFGRVPQVANGVLERLESLVVPYKYHLSEQLDRNFPGAEMSATDLVRRQHQQETTIIGCFFHFVLVCLDLVLC